MRSPGSVGAGSTLCLRSARARRGRLWGALLLLALGCAEKDRAPPQPTLPPVAECGGYSLLGTWAADVWIESRIIDPATGAVTDAVTDELVLTIPIHQTACASGVLGVAMYSLEDRLVIDAFWDDPLDLGFAYYQHATVSGELAEEGGAFWTRFVGYADGEVGTILERDWVFGPLTKLR